MKKINLKELPEFLIDCHNVYRTKYYVIKQKLVTTHNKNGESMTHSEDTYYLRNYETDRQFERFFNTRVNKEGRRVPSDTQTKHYRYI